jgi:hypothetical protein
MKTVVLKSSTGKKSDPDYKEASFDFSDPENLQEAVAMWSEAKVFSLAVAQAHTDAVNAKRLELKGKETGTLALGRSVAEAIKTARASGDAATIKALEDLLGVPLS